MAFPSDEDIVRWSNKMTELDDQKKYTATGSRIAIQERCAGARWMLSQWKKNDPESDLTVRKRGTVDTKI